MKTSPSQPHPGERIWKLRKGPHTFSCELRVHGGYGVVEARFFRDGEFAYGRRFETRALAARFAEEERQALRQAL